VTLRGTFADASKRNKARSLDRASFSPFFHRAAQAGVDSTVDGMVSSLVVKKYTVEQGDTLLSLFGKLGILDFDLFWDHADNRAVRERYEESGCLRAGDELSLPPEAVTIKLETGKHHTVVLKGPKVELVLLLESPGGLAFANSPYELTIGAHKIKGTTDGEGVLRERVPLTRKEALLRVTPAPELREQAAAECSEDETPDCGAEVYEWKLQLSEQLPLDVAGAQARLNNLGFQAGVVDGELGPLTEAALRDFQEQNGISESEPLGEQTRAQLSELSGR